MAARLTLQDVNLRFGGVKVLQEVGFEVEPGEVFGLVGPNGAGKTSLFNCISGHYKPTAGSDADRRARRCSPGRASGDARAHGLARTFQHPRCSCTRRCSRTCCSAPTPDSPAGPLEWSLRRAPDGARREELRAEALDLLERNGLGWAAHLPADELSHGLHKGVELCRALLMKPRLLLLDEPAAASRTPRWSS